MSVGVMLGMEVGLLVGASVGAFVGARVVVPLARAAGAAVLLCETGATVTPLVGTAVDLVLLPTSAYLVGAVVMCGQPALEVTGLLPGLKYPKSSSTESQWRLCLCVLHQPTPVTLAHHWPKFSTHLLQSSLANEKSPV